MKHHQTNAVIVSRDQVVAAARRALQTGHDQEAEALAQLLPESGPELSPERAAELDARGIPADEFYGLVAAALEGRPILVRN